MAQEDIQTLRAAADRLDQLLNEIGRSPAQRGQRERYEDSPGGDLCLDHLLSGMIGNEVMPELKLRPNRDTAE